MRHVAAVLAASVVLTVLATPAQALRCSDWTRMSPGAQEQTVSNMIYDSPNHRLLRGRQINATRLQMCLERSQRWIEADFNEACSRGQRESLQVLDNIFDRYVTSCTSGRVGGYR